MSDLVSELNDCRRQYHLGLRSVDLTEVHPHNPSDPQEVKGRIAETYVKQWLDKCQHVKVDRGFPRQVNDYTIEMGNTGITVYHCWRDEKHAKLEFDSAIFYEGQPHIVEVKSMRLNGFEKQISTSLRIGGEIYGDNVRMLLFFPLHSGKSEDAKRIERDYSQVSCVDLGYNRRDLDFAVDAFYALNPDIKRINYVAKAKHVSQKKSRSGRKKPRNNWNLGFPKSNC